MKELKDRIDYIEDKINVIENWLAYVIVLLGSAGLIVLLIITLKALN